MSRIYHLLQKSKPCAGYVTLVGFLCAFDEIISDHAVYWKLSIDAALKFRKNTDITLRTAAPKTCILHRQKSCERRTQR